MAPFDLFSTYIINMNEQALGSYTWKKEGHVAIYDQWRSIDCVLSLIFQAVADRGNGWAVSKGSLRKETCDWLVAHKFEIPLGELNIFDCPAGIYGRQISAVSKICHIINPIRYPLIWDTRVRKYLKANEENWKEKVEAFVKEHPEFQAESSDEFDKIWAAESNLWSIAKY